MKLKNLFFILALASVTFYSSSCKKEQPEPPEPLVVNGVVEWMYNEMTDVYYWNYTLPSFNSVKFESDPAVFFEKLIYTEEDFWSWLTDDFAALQNEFAGTPTSMGISPVFGKFTGSAQVFIIIAYTYPGSPADKAGLKRGDIILKINNQNLDTSNYSTLYNQDNFSVNLGVYNGTSIFPSSTSISLAAEIIDSNPIILDTIFDYNTHKIGYLVYVEFISGNNNSLLNDFGSVMDNYINQGITDLIVDLRYNPGGEITAANYLASCIAPLSSVSSKEIFVKFNYNSGIQQYFIARETSNSPNLVNRFSDNGHNLNLNRVFFLTGQHSASASELLMIGLKPYMEVIMLGEQTYGKFTGAWVLTDTNDPPKHNWAIVPIVSKYSNSVGFTDFKDGLVPDYLIDDDLLQAKAFGDVADPMLGQAVELITGQSLGLKKSTTEKHDFKQLFNYSHSFKYNLFLPKPEFQYHAKD